MRPDEVARIRKNLGLTQQALAEKLGVHRVAVARWETGSRSISEPAARLLLRIRDERGRGQGPRTRDKKSGRKRRG